MKVFFKNLSLCLASAACALLIAEVCLFVFSRAYYAYRVGRQESVLADADAIRILCLGDSFTFGMGARKGYSYPQQLERLLGERLGSKKFVVYNLGEPGNTSSKVLKRLEEHIGRYKPDFLVLLIGMNDNSHLEESDYVLGQSKIATMLDSRLESLRTYKLLKGLRKAYLARLWKKKLEAKFAAELKGRCGQAQDFPWPEEEETRLEYLRLISRGDDYYLLQTKISAAIEEWEKALALLPSRKEAYGKLAGIYLHTDQDDMAVDMLKKELELDPCDPLIYYGLWRAYYEKRQKALAREALERFLYLSPDSIPAYLSVLQYGVPDKNEKSVFETMLLQNISQICRLSGERKIKVILQNYPNDPSRLTLLREAALKNNVPFVDQHSAFAALKQQEGYRESDYFAEDTHCNEAGYAVMAENIYRLLKEQLEQAFKRKAAY